MSGSDRTLLLAGAVLYYLLFVRRPRTATELGAAAHPVSVVGGVSVTTPVVPAAPRYGRRRPLADGLTL